METFETGVGSDWNSKSFNREELGALRDVPAKMPQQHLTQKLSRVCEANLVPLQWTREPSDQIRIAQ